MSDIVRFKPLTQVDQFKGLDRSFSTQKVAYGNGSAAGADEGITWFLVDRTGETAWNTDDMKNLFFSFGLAREDDSADWDRAFGWVDWYRGRRMLIAAIPQSGCGSHIDGATLQVRVPVGSGASQYVTLYGASYAGYVDPETGYELSKSYEDSVYGCASVYLFYQGTDSDGVHPYTGAVDGVANPNSGLATWTGGNTDNQTFFPHLRAVHWGRNPDNGVGDIPYGIALLEKGIFVVFDMPGRVEFVRPSLTGAGIWQSVSTTFNALTKTGGTLQQNSSSNRRQIVFTGTNADVNARITYRTVDEEYKLIYFCHAGQNEFNSTSNHTYDHRKAFYRPEEADSVYITEVGLYDDRDQLLAYGKLSEPVEKNKLETITLKVELNLGGN